MKRYWKMLLISVVIILTIGFYYIQVALASKGDYSYKIETTSGNESEIENIRLEASFQRHYRGVSLEISKDGTETFIRSFSGLSGMLNPYVPDVVQTYVQDYRQFMRGKKQFEENYFEDETRLVYANIQGPDQIVPGDLVTMQLAILDKKAENHSSFEIEVPAQGNYYDMGVRDIFMQDGNIKIVAYNSLVNGGEEWRIYTVDEKGKTLQKDELLVKMAAEKGIESHLSMYQNDNEALNDLYYFYTIKKYKRNDYGPTGKLLSNQQFVYNKLKNEVEEIVIPSDLKPETARIFLYGGQLFIPIYSTEGIELNHYSIEMKQWEEPLHFDFPLTMDDDESPVIQLMGEKLYVVNRATDQHVFYIGDLRTGQSLYEGEIESGAKDLPRVEGKLYISSVLKK